MLYLEYIMCGRFVLMSMAMRVAEEFEIGEAFDITARYNIAPSQEIIGVVNRGAESLRGVDSFKWGLVPSWAKDPSIGARLINARSETIAQKPAFKRSFKSRRILIPANGFYEWNKATKPKRPYFIGLEGDALFAMAGIWDEWEGQRSQKIKSCSIITTNSNDLVERIHDRMPVIVRRNDYEAWLQSKPLSDSLASEIFRPFPANLMRMRPVSAKVNKSDYDAPDCIYQTQHSFFEDHLP